ncbi:MAG: NAD(P)/FAD-dependent oxidoreductase [bacterium]
MSPVPQFLLPEEHDLIIIGAGPAGTSAAITAAGHKADFLLMDQHPPMEKVRGYGRIANYPGLGIIGGEKLAQSFVNHLSALQIPVHRERVFQITRDAYAFQIYGHGKVYRARAVLLALGIVYEKKIPGEEALLGRGVSYCLTCDGLLYAGKSVGVIAETPEGEPEAVSLRQDYGAQVIFYATYACSARESLPEVYPKASIQRLERTTRGIRIVAQGLDDREVDGVFIFRQGASPASLLPGVAMDKHHVQVNKDMHTNVPGLFCAGDCTGPPYQISKAAGEGQVAALSAVKYLTQAR